MKKIIVFFILISLLSGCIWNKEDADGDGLIDEIEKEGWDLTVVYPLNESGTKIHVTPDVNKRDSDGDNLTDYQESPYFGELPTDPTSIDTDKDGLTDYEERVIFKTNPIDWRSDADDDNFPGWRGDYEEILYYRQRGIDNETIKKFLIGNPDVDNDGAKDGNDIDPLRNLKIEINITGLLIKSDMNENDGIIEGEINVTVGNDWQKFPSSPIEPWISIIPKANQSLDLHCVLDISDVGIPGNGTVPLMIEIIDLDRGLEKDYSDMILDFDVVRIDGNSSFSKNFNIFTDCGKYHVIGADGELWFEIKDVSEPWNE